MCAIRNFRKKQECYIDCKSCGISRRVRYFAPLQSFKTSNLRPSNTVGREIAVVRICALPVPPLGWGCGPFLCSGHFNISTLYLSGISTFEFVFSLPSCPPPQSCVLSPTTISKFHQTISIFPLDFSPPFLAWEAGWSKKRKKARISVNFRVVFVQKCSKSAQKCSY